MSGNNVILDLVSFGAYGHVRKAATRYEGIFTEYESCNSDYEIHKSELSKALVQLSTEKEGAFLEARKHKEISSALNTEERYPAERAITTKDHNLERINETINDGEIMLSAIVGVIAGAAAAIGVWGLMIKLGVASPGVPIAALKGADQAKAILMWLGGGVLPGHTGNLGVGIFTIANVFLVPMLLISAGVSRFFTRRKIRKIETATNQVEEITRQIKEDLPRLETLKDQAEATTRTVKDSKKAFLEWHEIYRMSETQRKEKLITLATSMLEVIREPMDTASAEGAV